MSRLGRISPLPQWSRLLNRVALASLIANVGIVATGGAVRLTRSGLGCPTWPECTDGSYVTTREMGINGAIEFGNRLLTFVVAALALVALILAVRQQPRRRSLVVLAAAVLAGIPAQAVIGGFTVLTNLNPWVVGLHFLASMAVIAAAYLLWVRARESDAEPEPTVPAALRSLAWALVGVSAATLVIGTFVTGSGPHAGDAGAKRNGLDPEAIAQLHADVVFLLLGMSVALWFALRAVSAPQPALRAVSAPRSAQRAALWLLAAELGQGVIGFVQYFTHLPVLLVGLHMVGSCLVWIAALGVLTATRVRPAVVGPPQPVVPEPGDLVSAGRSGHP